MGGNRYSKLEKAIREGQREAERHWAKVNAEMHRLSLQREMDRDEVITVVNTQGGDIGILQNALRKMSDGFEAYKQTDSRDQEQWMQFLALMFKSHAQLAKTIR